MSEHHVEHESMEESGSGAYTSRFSTYKKMVTSTEVSFASQTSLSTFEKEISSEFVSASGIRGSTKEITTGSDVRSLPVYITIQNFVPEEGDKDSMPLEQGQIVEIWFLVSGVTRFKISISITKEATLINKARPSRTGWVPGSYFETPTEHYKQRRQTREIDVTDVTMTTHDEAVMKRNAVYQELLRSEEQFVAELRHVIENYVPVFEASSTPVDIRHLKEQITVNIKELYNFHANVLLKGLQYYSDDPSKVGQTFVRLERDFDHHVKYCRDEKEARKAFEDPKVKEFFDKVSIKVESGDKKLENYLESIRDRLSQYQLYMKEFIKYESRADASTASLQRALELMLSVPQRAADAVFINNIQGAPADVLKLGRLMRHERFHVWENEKKGEGAIRYLFLFKSRIIITEQVEAEDPDEPPQFKHIATVRLNSSDIHESAADPDTFVVAPTDLTAGLPTFYLQAADQSAAEYARQAWMKDIVENKLLLQNEDENGTETGTEFVDLSEVRSEFSEYSTSSGRRGSHRGDGAEDGPPKKKTKSPPTISPSGSSVSIYSGSSGDYASSAGGTTLDMQGTKVTRTQYGFRTLQESTAKMCLKVTGFPLPNITWFKDETELQEDDRHKFYADDEGFFALTIDPVKVEDTGHYSCVASNEYGKATTSAFFRVIKMEKEIAEPKFISRIEDVEIEEGDTAVFECEVDGWPEPELSWLVDGQLIHASQDFRIEYDGQKAKLTIRDAQADDTGKYTCRITNDQGTADSNAKLIVSADPDKNKVAPEFQQRIEDIECWEGDTVKFKAMCTGDPVPEVTWMCNGVPITASDKVKFIAEDGIYMLIIQDVTKHFGGNITCQAANRLGEGNCHATLNVNTKETAPRFEPGLQPQNVKQGAKATFECEVVGSPDPVVTWTMNGRPVDNNMPGVAIVAAAPVYRLVIDNVMPLNACDIVCTATNKVGTAETKAPLTIIEPLAPKMTDGLKDKTVSDNEVVELVVGIECEDTPQIQWLVNGKPVTDADGYAQFSPAPGKFGLKIPAGKAKDAMKIEFQASNDGGKCSTDCSIQVKPSTEAPKFTKPMVAIDVAEGSPISSVVEVTGNPKPSLTWYLNRKQLTSGMDNVTITTDGLKSELKLSASESGHVGELSCVAENSAGSAETQGQVTVSKTVTSPLFVSRPANESVKEGEPVEFDVVVDGAPMPTVTWFINGKPVDKDCTVSSSGNKFILKCASVSLSHAGTITCKAENDGGAIECTAKLTVTEQTEAPKFTKPVTEQMCNEGDPLTWEVQVTGKPVPQVKWFLNGAELKPSAKIVMSGKGETSHSLKIEGLTADQGGKLECRATNSVGEATCTASVGVKKKHVGSKPKFQSELSPISITEGDILRTKVLVSGDPEPQVKWYINDDIVVKTEDTDLTVENGVYTLEIRGASTAMTGKLRCVAYNKMGEVSQGTGLTVINPVPVEFEQSLSDATCREGDTLKLKAVLIGEPTPDVTWYVNGKQLVESSKVKIQSLKGTYTVTIKDITCDYSGTVLCKAINEFGEASSSAKLIVLPRGEPPDFTEWMSNVSVREGGSVTHRVVFTGKPTPVLRWWINEDELRDGDPGIKIRTVGNVCTLYFSNFSSKFVGEIICQAENEAGEVSCTAMQVLMDDAMSDTGDAMADDDITEGDDDITMEEDAPLQRVATPINAPKFITKLSDVKVKKGQQAIFECVVPDTKGVVVKWYKDGKEITMTATIRMNTTPRDGHLVQQLIIDEAAVTDTGRYECVLVNDAGKEISAAQLDVLTVDVAPTIFTGLTDQSVKVNSSAKFECAIKGDPLPDVTWFKDGQPMKTEARIQTTAKDGNFLLIVKECVKSDAGQYKAVASNRQGSVESTAKLTIQADDVKPEFSVKMSDQSVYIKETATFELTAKTKTNATATWKRNGTELNIDGKRIRTEVVDTKYRLIITQCVIEDAASYACELRNSAGSNTNEARLTVKEKDTAPKFNSEMSDQTVKEGQTATFKCEYTGAPQPTAVWMLEKTVITMSSRIRSTIEKSMIQLVIDECKSTDIGKYTCKLANSAGEVVTSASLKVESSAVKPDFVKPLTATSVEQNGAVEMQCTVTGSPTPEIQWLKDGKPVVADANHIIEQITSDGICKLHVTNAASQDIGKYTCKASNSAGSTITESSLDVQLVVAPSFEVELPATEVVEAKKVELTCTLKAGISPKPEIVWTCNDKPIKSDQNVVIEHLDNGQLKLVIECVSSSDAGVYRCEAVNKAGKANTQADLKVNEATESKVKAKEVAPEITVPLKEQAVQQEEKVVLECAAKGVPAPEIKWYKDENQVQADDKHVKMESVTDEHQTVAKLTIEKAEATDIGSYRAQAVNNSGTAATTAELKINFAEQMDTGSGDTAPEFTKELNEKEVKSGESVVLECSVKGMPEPEIKWFKNDQPFVPDGKQVKLEVIKDNEVVVYKLKIDQADSKDVGVYKCVAENIVGKSSTEAQFKVQFAKKDSSADSGDQTAPEFTVPLGEHSIEQGESVVMECAVTGSPKPEIKWMKDDEEVKQDGKRIVIENIDKHQKLTISVAKSEDVGTYRCEATNKVGKASTEAPLDVKHASQAAVQPISTDTAPEFTTPLTDSAVEKGQDITLECTVKGSPAPVIHWMKDGKEVVPDGKHIVIESVDSAEEKVQRLVIHSAKAEDVGSYKCEAVNAAGKAETAAPLKIEQAKQMEVDNGAGQVAPEFTIPLGETAVEQGQTISLECAVKGSPAPEIHWMKDGKEVIPDGKHIVIESVDSAEEKIQRLVIHSAKSEDVGLYKCEAVSSAGKAETVAPLKIEQANQVEADDAAGQMAPEFTTPLMDSAVVKGQDITLECTVKGSPAPEIHWMKDGKKVVPDGKHIVIESVDSAEEKVQRLVIHSAKAEDVGSYKCEAVNTAGKAETAAPLKIEQASQMEVDNGAGQVAPEFTIPLGETAVEQGQTISLECAVKGSPAPEIHWMKDGKEVIPDGKHIVIESVDSAEEKIQRLVIHSAKSEDVGLYKCEAVSSAGKAETVAPLKIEQANQVEAHDAAGQMAPEFTTPLMDSAVVKGQDITLECTVKGSPAPEIHWMKDGKKVVPDGKHIVIESVDSAEEKVQRLVIHCAKAEDVGSYKCEAVNNAGKAETAAPLKIEQASQMEVDNGAGQVAPEFTIPLGETAVKQGQTISLECAVKGSPAPEIHWMKDGKEVIPDGKHIVIESVDSAEEKIQRLVIHSAKSEDVGLYKCEAVSSAGKAETVAPLKIEQANQVEAHDAAGQMAPEFTTPLMDSAVVKGQDITLECTVKGSPAPEIHWMKDGKKVVPDGKHIVIESVDSAEEKVQRLVIHCAKAEDVGSYKCEAVNTAGKAETAAPLKIEQASQMEVDNEAGQVAPEFTIPLGETAVEAGQAVNLECAVTGTPTPEVVWIKNGKEIKTDGKHITVSSVDSAEVKLHSLKIDSARSEDIGAYKCEAVNTAGKAETTAKLEVQFAVQESLAQEQSLAPEFTQPLKGKEIKAGETVELECNVVGTPQPQVKWLKDGNEVKPDGDHIKVESAPDGFQKLMIKDAKPDDVGQYECVAENSAGKATSDASMKVNVPQEQKVESDDIESAQPMAAQVLETVQPSTQPEFTKPLEAASVAVDGSVELTCRVTGSPQPAIQWLHDGQPIGDDDTHTIKSEPDGTQTLVLAHADLASVGDYECVASNDAGKAATLAPLNVASEPESTAPDFKSSLVGCQVTEGETITLTAKVDGEPKPTIRWFLGDKEIKPDGKKIIVESKPDGTQTLVIKDAQMADAGEYRCEATNASGVTWSDAPVTVKPEEIAPRFVKELAPSSTEEGQQVTFTCQVTGKPAPEVKWYKDGQEMSPKDGVRVIEAFADGTHTLSIPASRAEHQGNYKAEATNSVGSCSCRAPLSVNVSDEAEMPPAFTKKLQDLAGSEGDALILECIAGGKVDSVVWARNGTPLAESANIKMEKLTSGRQKLTIKKASKEDFGAYTCTVKNSGGEATTGAALKASITLGAFTTKLTDQTVEIGSSLTFKCKVEINDSLEVSWQKEGKPLSAGKGVTMTYDKSTGECSFKISSAEKTDQGVYKIVLKNEAGEVASEAKATVKAKAVTVVKGLVDQSVMAGDTVHFEVVCSAPVDSVAWLKNGTLVDVSTDRRIKIEKVNETTYRMSIKDTDVDVTGNYTVQLKSDAGTVESHARATVQLPAPSFLRGLADKTVDAGEKVVFTIETDSAVEKIEWFKDLKEIVADGSSIQIEKVSATKYQLTIIKSVVIDSGKYSVSIRNAGGEAKSQAQLTVCKALSQKPKISTALKDQSVLVGQSCTFTVKCSGDPPTEAQWKKDGVPLSASDRVKINKVDDNTYTLTIEDCQLDDSSSYTVGLKNDGGSTESSAALTVKLPPPPKPEIMKGLNDQTVQLGNDCSMEVEINTKAKSVKWYKNGFELRLSNRVKPEQLSDTKYRLEIAQSVADDDATYKVVLENESGKVESSAKLTVKLPPEPSLVLKKDLTNQKITEEREATFVVEIKGRATSIKWFKNGKLIEASTRIRILDEQMQGRFSLTIPSCTKDDEGTYHVELSNEELSVSSSHVDLNIRIPEAPKEPDSAPVFVVPLSMHSFTEDQDAMMEVKIRGKPKPDVRWMHNDKVVDSERVVCEDMCDGRWRVTIKRVQLTDAGKYTCEATNSVGSAGCSGTLNVKPAREKRKPDEDRYPPKFNVLLRDRRILEENQAISECFVDAKPKASIVWTKDGLPLEVNERISVETGADGRCALIIKGFSAEDVATYRCVATNDLGKAETNGRLMIEKPSENELVTKRQRAPRFVQDPTSDKAVAGQDVIIECKVDGDPEPIITWFKDGVPVKLDRRVQAEFNPETGIARLHIKAATAADAGAYRAVASNEYGSSNAGCQLFVAAEKEQAKSAGKAPFFVKGLVDSWFEKGGDGKWMCIVDGDPMPEMKWYKDGTLLRSSGRYWIEQSADGECTLTVRNCAFSDEGIYRCEARNDHGTAKTQATAHIEEMRHAKPVATVGGDAPRFTIQLEDMSRVRGTTFELECKVVGNPNPTVKWTKDGAALYFDSRITMEAGPDPGMYKVSIRDARPSDEGTYRCVANNDAGSASTKSLVKIDSGGVAAAPSGPTSGPKFSVPAGDVRTNEGKPIKLECKVNGSPLPTVTWYKDGEKLDDGPGRTIELLPDGTCRLTIPSATAVDAGMYRIVAVNPDGSQQIKCNVNVRPSLFPDQNLQQSLQKEDNVSGRSPRLTQSLETVKTCENGTITLNCRFVGTKPLIPQWFKDGERLYPFGRIQLKEHGSGDYEVKITNVTKTDGGCYRCVCENDWGTARTNCEVLLESRRGQPVRNGEDSLLKGNAPGFSTPLTVRRVKQGGSITFECCAFGTPFPAIKWLKDGVEIANLYGRYEVQQRPDGTQLLVMTDVSLNDEGLVRCVATNAHGTTSTKAELIVDKDASQQKPKMEVETLPQRSKRPHFRQPLHNATVPQASVAEFVAVIAGHPTATVKWYRNGKEIHASEKCMIFTDQWGMHHLIWLNAQMEDQGEIMCIAKNEMGEAKSEAMLAVLKPRDGMEIGDIQNGDAGDRGPIFIKQLRPRHTFAGVPVVIDCIVDGHPMPDLTWYKDGKKLERSSALRLESVGDGCHVIVIPQAQITDSGEYMAVAENKVGIVRSSCKITVNKPDFDTNASDEERARIAGDWWMMKYNYTGIPHPPDRGPFIAEASGHYLTLSWIPTKRVPPRYEQITYVVEMRELPYPDWEVLDYIIPEPVCKVRNLELGKSYQFRVRAENIYGISDPSPASPPSKLMSKPQQVLDANRRPIPLVDPWMEQARNKTYGEKYACAPWFTPKEQTQTYCAINESTEITCNVSGFPDPKIMWLHKGAELDSMLLATRVKSTVLGGTQCILNIHGFQSSDIGQWTCVASNEYGEAQQSVWLEKAEHPQFVDALNNATASLGKTVSIKTRFDGNPSPDIKWVKDWHPVTDSMRIRMTRDGQNQACLTITETILRDTGVYTCIATNEAGRATSSATITILPEVEETFRLTPMTRRRAAGLEPVIIREQFELNDELAT